jgi:hypothetical protein
MSTSSRTTRVPYLLALAMACLMLPLSGCKNSASSGTVSPASFGSDPSKMTPEAKRLMEESMRSARQPAKAPGK